MQIGDFVIVRTYSAGVHYGTLAERSGKEVALKDARRLWSWSGGRLSLSDIAVHGVVSARISAVVSEIVLTEAIELIAVTEEGRENLTTHPACVP